MNNDLAKKYVKLHKQGWLPILVSDELDALELARISVTAGCQAIEITCRRQGVVEEIRRIKKQFPELIVLVGSVVDDGPLLTFLQSRRPDFPSLRLLAELGVDGFVALLPFSRETITRYKDSHLLMPGVETFSEAVDALNAGAHFVKFCFSPPERLKQLTSAPTHQLLPVFFTGGVKLETVSDYIGAGAALLGGGWDLMLNGIYPEMQAKADPEIMTARLLAFCQAVYAARLEHWPGYDRMLDMDTSVYLQAVSQYHPFAASGARMTI